MYFVKSVFQVQCISILMWIFSTVRAWSHFSQKQKSASAKIEENKRNRSGGTRFLWNVFVFMSLCMSEFLFLTVDLNLKWTWTGFYDFFFKLFYMNIVRNMMNDLFFYLPAPARSDFAKTESCNNKSRLFNVTMAAVSSYVTSYLTAVSAFGRLCGHTTHLTMVSSN